MRPVSISMTADRDSSNPNDGASDGHTNAGVEHSQDETTKTHSSRVGRPAGDEAPRRLSLAQRDRLINQHMRLVRAVAATLRPRLGRALEFDDLVGSGAKGLVEAAERFDPDHHGAFSTFVYYRIRGAMLDSAKRTGAYSRLDVARSRAEAELGEADTTGNEAGDKGKMNRLGDILCRIATVQRDMSGNDREPLTPDRVVELAEIRTYVRSAVATLPPRERRFIELYYLADKSLAEVMTELGAVSKGRTWELHDKAIAALRQRLERARAELLEPRIPPRRPTRG